MSPPSAFRRQREQRTAASWARSESDQIFFERFACARTLFCFFADGQPIFASSSRLFVSFCRSVGQVVTIRTVQRGTNGTRSDRSEKKQVAPKLHRTVEQKTGDYNTVVTLSNMHGASDSQPHYSSMAPYLALAFPSSSLHISSMKHHNRAAQPTPDLILDHFPL